MHLKYDEPTIKGSLRRVNKDNFENFYKDYKDSQEIKTNPVVVELRFRIETQTQKKIGSKVRTSETSETSETFHDGDEEEGLSLYIKGEVEITEVYRTRNRLWWITWFKIIHINSSNKIGIYV